MSALDDIIQMVKYQIITGMICKTSLPLEAEEELKELRNKLELTQDHFEVTQKICIGLNNERERRILEGSPPEKQPQSTEA